MARLPNILTVMRSRVLYDLNALEEDSALFRCSVMEAEPESATFQSRRLFKSIVHTTVVCAVSLCLVFGTLALLRPGIAIAGVGPGPCSSSTSGFDGARNTSISGVTGARAQIDNDNPYVCADPARGSSSAWSMLNSSDQCNWAQVGWDKDYSSSRAQFFFETTHICGNSTIYFFGTPALMDSHTYEVDYIGNYTFNYYLDGSKVGSQTESASDHWLPAGVQYSGEVHDMSDQMPGGTSSYVFFQNVQWRQNGTWYGGNVVDYDNFKYGGIYFPGTYFGIYDTQYSS